MVSDPLSDVARTFQDLGVCVVQQCAKIRQQGKKKKPLFTQKPPSYYKEACIQEENLLSLISFECMSSVKNSFLTVSTAVTYDKYLKAIRVKVPNSDEEFLLHPATVRRNDRSAQSVV